ncbi:MAG: hypothetical protein ACO4AA_05865, partial [Aquiluna sp.]
MLTEIQQEIGQLFGHDPLDQDECNQPADTSGCDLPVRIEDNWPEVKWNGDWYPVPTMELIEEWVFDSVCDTPDEDTVEPDHPDSWLS